MGLPAAKTQICNMALMRVGQARINNIDPPSTETEVMLSESYDASRQTVLRLHTWNFAKARAACSRVDDATPTFDYTDAYRLPNDFIRFCNIDDGFGLGESSWVDNYDISGRYVLVNNSGASSINVRYIQDVTDVTLWDALFRELVILQIACDIAFPLTKREKMVERLEGLFARKMREAMSIDGQEHPPTVREDSALINARMEGNPNSRDNRYVTFT